MSDYAKPHDAARDRRVAFDAIPMDVHSGPRCPCARCSFGRVTARSDALLAACERLLTIIQDAGLVEANAAYLAEIEATMKFATTRHSSLCEGSIGLACDMPQICDAPEGR